MDDKWKQLASNSIRWHAPEGEDTDELAMPADSPDWKKFYRDFQGFVDGCVYAGEETLAALCSACAREDDLRLLRAIEQKERLLDVAMLLRAVEHPVRIKWLREGDCTSPLVLFECLRREMLSAGLAPEEQDAVAGGICRLTELGPAYARALFQQIRGGTKDRPVVEKLLGRLSRKGWEVLADSVSFGRMTPEKTRFWDQCGAGQDWDKLQEKAQPLVDAWEAYLTESIRKGEFSDQLYNAFSNWLLGILRCRLGTAEAFEEAGQKALDCCRAVLQRWYESSVQQEYGLLAALARVALLRYVWSSQESLAAAGFPENLRRQTLALLDRSRYLWEAGLYPEAAGRIRELEGWLEQQQAEPGAARP